MLKGSALDVLCDPETHAPLTEESDALVNPKSGKRFSLRDGVPCFINEARGINRKYQSMYDWLAPFYDAGEHAYFWLTRKESYRLALRRSLDVPYRQIGPLAGFEGSRLACEAERARRIAVEVYFDLR